MQEVSQKLEAGGEANLGKDKFISQIIDELGIGKTGKSLPEFLFNMARKIAELCYEVKQLKGKN